jgi:hypothetical protein
MTRLVRQTRSGKWVAVVVWAVGRRKIVQRRVGIHVEERRVGSIGLRGKRKRGMTPEARRAPTRDHLWVNREGIAALLEASATYGSFLRSSQNSTRGVLSHRTSRTPSRLASHGLLHTLDEETKFAVQSARSKSVQSQVEIWSGSSFWVVYIAAVTRAPLDCTTDDISSGVLGPISQICQRSGCYLENF